ncbi:MAG TPA: hypothetical protein IAA75_08885 [Candidatus Pullichristensenella avicola]|nr:hypothetical protein [Candidatus Pullichristensenella avicola]
MRAGKIIALLLAVACLTGCESARQVESIAFAVVLGADLTEDENIELTVQIPKSGAQSDGDEGEGNSDYLIASARGSTFTDALMGLDITVPRDLSLTQVKLLVVSEALARHEKFFNLAESLAKQQQTCSSAYFAVCRGEASAIVREQKPVIGMRVSSGIIAMFEHHRTRGYITGANFADFYYQGVSVFSDPVAILCAATKTGPEEPSEEHALDGMTPETVAAESENYNEYVGAALFRDGLMVGILDGQETCLLNAVRGAPVFFNYSLEGMPVSLQSQGVRDMRIGEDENGETRVAFSLQFTVVADLKAPPVETLRETLREDLLELLRLCQRLQVEPFGFAEHRAADFASLAQWQRYDWKERFVRSSFDVEVNITVTDA